MIATAVAHVNRRVPGLRRHRGRDDARGGPAHEDGREGRRRRRLGHHAVLRQPTQQEIFDHYRRIAESTSLPVVLYNNPATCGGVKIDVDTVGPAGGDAEHPRHQGLVSGDLQNTNEYIRVVPERFSVLMGRDTLIFPALMLGARGAVPATATSRRGCSSRSTRQQSRRPRAAQAAAQRGSTRCGWR